MILCICTETKTGDRYSQIHIRFSVLFVLQFDPFFAEEENHLEDVIFCGWRWWCVFVLRAVVEFSFPP